MWVWENKRQIGKVFKQVITSNFLTDSPLADIVTKIDKHAIHKTQVCRKKKSEWGREPKIGFECRFKNTLLME